MVLDLLLDDGDAEHDARRLRDWREAHAAARAEEQRQQHHLR